MRIASWRDVDELDRMPRLRELRLSGNPLVADARGGGRFEVRGAAGPGWAGVAGGVVVVRDEGLEGWRLARSREVVPGRRRAGPAARPRACLVNPPAPQARCRILSYSINMKLLPRPRAPQIIARVGGLALLNGADVKPRERRDCELRYLQAVSAEEAACGEAQRAARRHWSLAPRIASRLGQRSARERVPRALGPHTACAKWLAAAVL